MRHWTRTNLKRQWLWSESFKIMRLSMNSPAMCTGVRPCCVSVVRGDAPWLRRMWTQSVWPRRAARARGVLPASSPWSTSVSPCSSTSRAWAWPWYACTRHRRRQPLIHRVAKKLCFMYNTSIQPLHLQTKNLKLLLYLKLLAVIYTSLKEVLNSSDSRHWYWVWFPSLSVLQ